MAEKQKKQEDLKKKSDELDTNRDKPVHLTMREAKHVILRGLGYASRSEAYMRLAKERRELVEKETGQARNDALKALGLDPNKATESVVYQRLGLRPKDAANVNRAIAKQKKKRALPSWRV